MKLALDLLSEGGSWIGAVRTRVQSMFRGNDGMLFGPDELPF